MKLQLHCAALSMPPIVLQQYSIARLPASFPPMTYYLPVDRLLAQVSPENGLLVKVCIQSHCVSLLLNNLSVLLPLQAQTTDITAVGEDQAGLLT